MFHCVPYCFGAHKGCFQHLEKHLDCVLCSKIFLRAGNNSAVLKNSTEHAETLFIALFAAVNLNLPR